MAHAYTEHEDYIENSVTQSDEPVRSWRVDRGAIRQWCEEQGIPVRDLNGAMYYGRQTFVIDGRDDDDRLLIRLRWL